MNFNRGMHGFKDEPLSLEQAEKLNAVFRKYELKEMSMSASGSHSLWFINGPIYRKVNHLDRGQIFSLAKELIDSVFTVSWIVCGLKKTIEIVIDY